VIDKLLKWLEIPIHVLMWIGLLAGVLMMTHVSLDVAGRELVKPIAGTTEIVSGYYMIAVAYLPWALIARNDEHIMVELFTQKLSPLATLWLDIVMKAATVAYVCIFSWTTWFRAVQQMNAGEALQVAGDYLIVWPSRFVLPVAGGMMALYLVVRLARDTREALRGRVPPKESSR